MHLREILIIDDSLLARQLRHVVSVVDQLHHFPRLPSIALKLTKSRREGGGYVFRARPPLPVSINISIYTDSPPITLLHEIGHLLDHLALNPIKQGFGSEHDPLFDALRSFWAASKKIRRLTTIAYSKRSTNSPARAFLRYQLRVAEIWARTYLQWVVAKSDDLLLQVSLRHIISDAPEIYWDAAEIDAMISLVDRVFSEAGLQ